MSFLFKSKSKGASGPGNPPSSALPAASRDIRSSDGHPPATANGHSAIPTLTSSKPGSPTPGQQPISLNGFGAIEQLPRSLSAQARGATPEDKMLQGYARGQDEGMAGRISAGPPSPEQKTLRDRSQDTKQRLPVQRLNPIAEPSPYPWSQRRLNFTVSHTNPFPRYGAAVNGTSSKDGSIYIMGGLINGSTVKGDLWLVENGPSGNMTCYPVATTSEGPGPRVGHASLLVGNAFIVFGGDTKTDEGDQLDDTLYLLNTSTKQWSRALPNGPRPPGRYGHTLNILGSKLYIFGGQVEGYFFNDLVSFDLNALQASSNRWEILIQNTIDGGPPHGQIPPARTNHTMITYGDKLYLFGGTDGVHWFNDVWSYSPHTNAWTQLECIGFIPPAREGHAAALVGDVMYIFGGRTEAGTDLGDLAAFRITSRRWYTFQNMGPNPSPRSGHSMTTLGKSIVVLAGEPSSAPRDPVELGLAYFLDTSKIRYPMDGPTQPVANERPPGTRRPSGERAIEAPAGRPQGSPREMMDREQMEANRARGESNSRLPRAATQQSQAPAPSGPPPQAPAARPNGIVASRQPTRTPDRAFSPSLEAERARVGGGAVSPQNPRDSPAFDIRERNARAPSSPLLGERQGQGQFFNGEQAQSQQTLQQEQAQRFRPETNQPSQEPTSDGGSATSVQRSTSRGLRNQSQPTPPSDFTSLEGTPRASVDDVAEPFPKVRQLQQDEIDAPQDSGIGSSPALAQQNDELLRELDQARQKNAWFASELALARKSGYAARTNVESPVFDGRAADVFAEDDRPMIEALLKMRAELARVQETIDSQSQDAATRIAEMEKQRDAAVQEAVFAKARLAGQGSDGSSDGKRGAVSPDQDRSGDMGKRLAAALAAHAEESRKHDALSQQIDSEKQARSLAEDTAEAAQKRVVELDASRQQHSSELESLRSELRETQAAHRDIMASHAEVSSQHQLLSVDKRELSGRLDTALAESQDHAAVLASLRQAVQSSSDKADLLQQHLNDERQQRDALQQELSKLKAEHEERAAALDSAHQRFRDTQALAERHAQEAQTHREAVLAGLGKVSERNVDSSIVDDRVSILQQQVETANNMTRQNQQAADLASEKLRRAEERIAGLEAYQEQASREGLGFRKQLQAAMRDKQTLTHEKALAEQKLQSQLLETNALSVQHTSLKDILAERGINPADVRRSRALDSPASSANRRFSTPDIHRVRDLEQQLEASLRSHEEMKSQFEEVTERDEKMKKEYEDKLTALDHDHQAAVKYLRGTEKMLSKMKQELQRVKNENGELKKRVDKAKDEGTGSSSPGWESERENMKREVESVQAELKKTVGELETKIETMQGQLSGAERELHETRAAHATSQADFTSLQASHTQTRGDIERLQQENVHLESRARDAENKVQLLLDQVESSVDNYRRQSRVSDNATPTMNGGTFYHTRGLSNTSNSTAQSHTGHGVGHARNLSNADSTLSVDPPTSAEDGRNSLALDSLATELDALRTHWETTNKNYRLSDKFDFERTSSNESSEPSGAASGQFGGLANWRRGLDLADEDDDSRPATAAGHNDEGQETPLAQYPRQLPHQSGHEGLSSTAPSGMI